MKYKSKTCNLVKSFVSLIKTKFQTTIKIIRTDNELEFLLKYTRIKASFIRILVYRPFNKMRLFNVSINIFFAFPDLFFFNLAF